MSLICVDPDQLQDEAENEVVDRPKKPKKGTATEDVLEEDVPVGYNHQGGPSGLENILLETWNKDVAVAVYEEKNGEKTFLWTFTLPPSKKEEVELEVILPPMVTGNGKEAIQLEEAPIIQLTTTININDSPDLHDDLEQEPDDKSKKKPTRFSNRKGDRPKRRKPAKKNLMPHPDLVEPVSGTALDLDTNDLETSDGEAPAAPVPEVALVPSEKHHKCPNCSKEFSLSGSLKRHIVTQHTAKERPYQCPTCPKRCWTPSQLKLHSFTHVGMRPYECPYCSKGFGQSGTLNRHMLTCPLR